MQDLIYLAIAAALTGLTYGFVRLAGHLAGGRS